MTTEVQDDQSDTSFWSMAKAELPFLLMIVAGIFAFRGLIYSMNYIPSESMQPSLEVGDRIVVNKFAYGFSGHSMLFSLTEKFPGKYGRLFGSLPKRGDVITFKHPRSSTIYIKRVIGLPGDTVEYRGGQLYLNGELQTREKIGTLQYREHKGRLKTVSHYNEVINAKHTHEIFEVSDTAFLDNVGPFVVPADNVFVMGDNRDNSVDSREMRTSGVGFLPAERILGRAERVLYSTYKCKKVEGLRCAKRKFFMPIK